MWYFLSTPSTGIYNLSIESNIYVFNRDDDATAIASAINLTYPDVIVSGTGVSNDPFTIILYGLPGDLQAIAVANIDVDATIKDNLAA